VTLASSSATAFRYNPTTQVWDNIKLLIEPRAYLDASSDSSGNFYTYSTESVNVYSGGSGELGDYRYEPPEGYRAGECRTEPGDRSTQIKQLDRYRPPRLDPANARIVLKPGQTKTVPYEFSMSAAPTPLDLFFLIDTSGSTSSSICGLRKGMKTIVRQLQGIGIDARFGLGEFKDYPPPYGIIDNDFAYQLDRKLGPADAVLRKALQKLESYGGGDPPEAALDGLYQAALGAGNDALPSGPSSGDIPPGQAAGFRQGDVARVIVTITDNSFRVLPPSPAFQTVSDALVGESIMQAGISIAGGGSVGAGFTDLSNMAKATNAIAVKDLDCDGNASIDVHSGDPLVCVVAAGGQTIELAPAIVSIIRSIEDVHGLALHAKSNGPVVAGISGALPAVDLKEPQDAVFGVTYSCEKASLRHTYRVRLSADADARSLATAQAKVVCLGLPRAPQPHRPPVQFVVPPVVPPNLPRIPEQPPVQAIQPRVEVQGQANTQGQGQTSAAMAAQRQEQPQAAFVLASQGLLDQAANETAMISAARPRDPLSSIRLYLGAGAASIVLLFSYAHSVARVLGFRRTRN
jgi:hypothetical protein